MPEARRILFSLFDRGTVLARSLHLPPAAVATRTPSCRSGARVCLKHIPGQTKKTPYGVFLVWRRKRDSNPRAGESRPNGLANRPLRPTWVFLRIKKLLKKSGGEGEIRTHGPYESLVFKTSSLNHSDTSPQHSVILTQGF